MSRRHDQDILLQKVREGTLKFDREYRFRMTQGDPREVIAVREEIWRRRFERRWEELEERGYRRFPAWERDLCAILPEACRTQGPSGTKDRASHRSCWWFQRRIVILPADFAPDLPRAMTYADYQLWVMESVDDFSARSDAARSATERRVGYSLPKLLHYAEIEAESQRIPKGTVLAAWIEDVSRFERVLQSVEALWTLAGQPRLARPAGERLWF